MFTSAVMREGTGGMTTTMVASRRVDFNLNHTPPPAYEDPVKEGLKQAMIQHEIVFKNQVRELHRLYWTQKNLMNEIFWKRSDSVSVREGEKKADGVRTRLPMVNSMQMQMRNFDLHLPVDEFFIDATKEVTNAFAEVNSSGFEECVFGAGHMSLDLRTREARVNSSFGFKVLADNAANTSRSRVTVSSDFCSVSRMRDESGRMLTENCSHMERQTERWPEQNFILSKVGLKEHRGSLSANSPIEKQQPKYELMHIDLNIAQDEEPANVFPNTVETYHSPSTSSSVVLHGDNLRVSRSNGGAKESTVTVQPGVVSLGSENSREKSADSLPCEPKDSYPPSVQASGQSSNVTENNWNYKEYIADNEIFRSGIGSPKECCKSLVERFSSAYNGEIQDNTNGTVLADLHKLGKENIDSSFGLPNFPVHSDSRKNISISRNYMEHNCLHASAGSTNLPPNIAGGLEEKQAHNDGSEEDTVSSHAIAPDELKESSIGIKLNQVTRDRECTSKKKSVAEHVAISNIENSGTTHSDLVTPERICSKQVPNIEASGGLSSISIQDRPCNFDASQPTEDMEQHLAHVAELDHIIKKAAETLLSISSANPMFSLDRLTGDRQMEFECDTGNDQPQSSDSFETITLKLQEEIRDDGSSICAGQIDNETIKDGCGVRLRRGRRLRDFQKDILPGIISLSRHEICEDLYAIKYELRKKRSRRTCEKDWLVPVRSRRSRR